MVNPNGSEAYDLSLFEPREPKLVALKPNKKAVKEARRRARVQSFLNTALTLLTAAAVVAVVGLLISSRVRLTELNSEKSRRRRSSTRSSAKPSAWKASWRPVPPPKAWRNTRRPTACRKWSRGKSPILRWKTPAPMPARMGLNPDFGNRYGMPSRAFFGGGGGS